MRLSSDEYIGLRGVCRLINEAGAIKVTLASGSELMLGDAGDVRAVRERLQKLDSGGRARLFRPREGVVVNLAQVTNVWNESGRVTFWGMDGSGWSLEPGPAADEAWQRLIELIENEPQLRRLTPRLVLNLSHLQHASMVDGKLRLLMSNGTWPNVDDPEEAASAQAALRRAAGESGD